MLIYRIENKESGKGPYKDKGYAYGSLKMNWKVETNHRTWQHDFEFEDINNKLNLYAGVQSLSLLTHWFSPLMLAKLSYLNYVLQVYDEEPYLMSNLMYSVFLSDVAPCF